MDGPLPDPRAHCAKHVQARHTRNVARLPRVQVLFNVERLRISEPESNDLTTSAAKRRRMLAHHRQRLARTARRSSFTPENSNRKNPTEDCPSALDAAQSCFIAIRRQPILPPRRRPAGQPTGVTNARRAPACCQATLEQAWPPSGRFRASATLAAADLSLRSAAGGSAFAPARQLLPAAQPAPTHPPPPAKQLSLAACKLSLALSRAAVPGRGRAVGIPPRGTEPDQRGGRWWAVAAGVGECQSSTRCSKPACG